MRSLLLIFGFLVQTISEPSCKQTYGSVCYGYEPDCAWIASHSESICTKFLGDSDIIGGKGCFLEQNGCVYSRGFHNTSNRLCCGSSGRMLDPAEETTSASASPVVAPSFSSVKSNTPTGTCAFRSYDAATDFSGTQGANGWYYGYYNGGVFTQFTNYAISNAASLGSVNSWNYNVNSNGNIGANMIMPNGAVSCNTNTYGDVAPVLRWYNPPGSCIHDATIVVTVNNGSPNGGIVTGLTLNGQSVYSSSNPGVLSISNAYNIYGLRSVELTIGPYNSICDYGQTTYSLSIKPIGASRTVATSLTSTLTPSNSANSSTTIRSTLTPSNSANRTGSVSVSNSGRSSLTVSNSPRPSASASLSSTLTGSLSVSKSGSSSSSLSASQVRSNTVSASATASATVFYNGVWAQMDNTYYSNPMANLPYYETISSCKTRCWENPLCGGISVNAPCNNLPQNSSDAYTTLCTNCFLNPTYTAMTSYPGSFATNAGWQTFYYYDKIYPPTVTSLPTKTTTVSPLPSASIVTNSALNFCAMSGRSITLPFIGSSVNLMTNAVGASYLDSANCDVYIYGAGAGMNFNINLNSFSTEGCCDFLRIYNSAGTQIYVNSGNPGATTLIASGPFIRMQFTTDGSVVGPGINAVVSLGFSSPSPSPSASPITSASVSISASPRGSLTATASPSATSTVFYKGLWTDLGQYNYAMADIANLGSMTINQCQINCMQNPLCGLIVVTSPCNNVMLNSSLVNTAVCGQCWLKQKSGWIISADTNSRSLLLDDRIVAPTPSSSVSTVYSPTPVYSEFSSKSASPVLSPSGRTSRSTLPSVSPSFSRSVPATISASRSVYSKSASVSHSNSGSPSVSTFLTFSNLPTNSEKFSGSVSISPSSAPSMSVSSSVSYTGVVSASMMQSGSASVSGSTSVSGSASVSGSVHGSASESGSLSGSGSASVSVSASVSASVKPSLSLMYSLSPSPSASNLKPAGPPPALPANLSALSLNELGGLFNSMANYPPAQLGDNLQKLGMAALANSPGGEFGISTSAFSVKIKALGGVSNASLPLSVGNTAITMPKFAGGAAASAIQWTSDPYNSAVTPDSMILSLNVLDKTGAAVKVKNSSQPIIINMNLVPTPGDPRFLPLPSYLADCRSGSIYKKAANTFADASDITTSLGYRSWSVPCLMDDWRNVTCGPSDTVVTYSCPPLVYTPKCQYWDSGLGKWSTDGCVPIFSNATLMICSCDHLTDFSSRIDAVVAGNQKIFAGASSVYSVSGLVQFALWYGIFGGLALVTLLLGYFAGLLDRRATTSYVKELLHNKSINLFLSHNPDIPIFAYDPSSKYSKIPAVKVEKKIVQKPTPEKSLSLIQRVFLQHSRLQFLFKYDPRLSRVFRLLFLFVLQFHSLFITAFMYNFTYNGMPMQWYDNIMLSLITTLLNMPVVRLIISNMNKIGMLEFQAQFPLLFEEYNRRLDFETYAMFYIFNKEGGEENGGDGNDESMREELSFLDDDENSSIFDLLAIYFCNKQKPISKKEELLMMSKKDLMKTMAAIVKEPYPYYEQYGVEWQKMLCHTWQGGVFIAACCGWLGWCLNYLLLFASSHSNSVGETIMTSYATSELTTVFLIQPFTILMTTFLYYLVKKYQGSLPTFITNFFLGRKVKSIPSMYYFSDPWNKKSKSPFTSEFAYSIFVACPAAASGSNELAYASIAALSEVIDGSDHNNLSEVLILYRRILRVWEEIKLEKTGRVDPANSIILRSTDSPFA